MGDFNSIHLIGVDLFARTLSAGRLSVWALLRAMTRNFNLIADLIEKSVLWVRACFRSAAYTINF